MSPQPTTKYVVVVGKWVEAEVGSYDTREEALAKKEEIKLTKAPNDIVYMYQKTDGMLIFD